jgi:hypothetical protein
MKLSPPIIVTVTGANGDDERIRMSQLIYSLLSAEDHVIVKPSIAFNKEIGQPSPPNFDPVTVLLDARSFSAPTTDNLEEQKQNQKAGLIGCGLVMAFFVTVLLILAVVSRLPNP